MGYSIIELSHLPPNISYLTHPDGEQIYIRTRANNYDQYIITGSDRTRLTLIDLVQKRQNVDLTEALDILQNYHGLRNISQSQAYRTGIKPVLDVLAAQKQRKIKSQLARFAVAKSSSYLESLGIETETLLEDRFIGTILTDTKRSRVVFPHQNHEGFTGYQGIAKNVNGFSRDGTKSLWQSNFAQSDRHLVIVASPIDALAHYQLHRQAQTRYIALSHKPSSTQLELGLDMARSFIRQGGIVTAASSNNSAGEQIFESISSQFPSGLIRNAKSKKPTFLEDVLEKRKLKREHNPNSEQDKMINRFDKFMSNNGKTDKPSESVKKNNLQNNRGYGE